MRNEGTGKLRLLYILKLLAEETDENHMLSTAQIQKILQDRYGIHSHRITVGDDIQLLQMGLGIKVGKIESTQNKYWMISRSFELPELMLLANAVASYEDIPIEKRAELLSRIAELGSPYEKNKLLEGIVFKGRASHRRKRYKKPAAPKKACCRRH